MYGLMLVASLVAGLKYGAVKNGPFTWVPQCMVFCWCAHDRWSAIKIFFRQWISNGGESFYMFYAPLVCFSFLILVGIPLFVPSLLLVIWSPPWEFPWRQMVQIGDLDKTMFSYQVCSVPGWICAKIDWEIPMNGDRDCTQKLMFRDCCRDCEQSLS